MKITQSELESAPRMEIRAALRELFDGAGSTVDDEFFVHGIPSFPLKCKNAAWQKPYGVRSRAYFDAVLNIAIFPSILYNPFDRREGVL